MDLYGWLWLGWGLYFAVVETIAIADSRHKGATTGNYKDGTLSAHVWVWFGTAPGTHANSWAYVRRFVLLAFMTWLTVHFATGGRYV